MILPGATLGVLGGGQLGRMFTLQARTMGYRVVVLDPDPGSPAGQLADRHLRAAYTDPDALDQLARDCAAITTEFENVPAEALERLSAWVRVRPPVAAVASPGLATEACPLPSYPIRLVLSSAGVPTVRTAAASSPLERTARKRAVANL